MTASSRASRRCTALLVFAIVVFVTGICFAGEHNAKAPDTAGARRVVSQAMSQVLTALSDKNLSDEQRLRRIEEVAYANFDFETMSKLVLARNWKKFSKEERRQFVVEFRNLLARSYGSRLKRYSDEGVEVVGSRAEPRGDVTVQTQIVGGGFDGATVDYRMRKRGSQWKAIDVVVEGVSLVSSYRSQFRKVLSGSSPQKLLQRMREKNAFTQVDV